MARLSVRRRVVRFQNGQVAREWTDSLAGEEPLELRVDKQPLAVTMRTPGHDVELAHGFLLTEGVIGQASDISTARYCDSLDDDGRNTYNVLDIRLAEHVPPPDPGVQRNFYTTSSCGVCGKASLEAVRLKTRHSPADDPAQITPEVLTALPEILRDAQRVFDRTGGLHAAGLFTTTGEQLVVREDVGRHNAVDKVIGWAALNGAIPARGRVLMVSGRASFELVQKAIMAGISVLGAVSAPSSLAVELADDAGLTLVGFIRGDSMNVYTHGHRIAVERAVGAVS